MAQTTPQLTGTTAAIRAEQMLEEALKQSATRQVRRLPVVGVPDGPTPEATCLIMVTVWLHAFVRVLALLYCDVGMNGLAARIGTHPTVLSRLVISCCN